MGFEPTTASLEGWNSTTELRPPALTATFSGCILNNNFLAPLDPTTEDSDKETLSALYCLSPRITTRAPCRACTAWWAGKDSNLGSRWQQIYSLPPLATWVPARNTLHTTR